MQQDTDSIDDRRDQVGKNLHTYTLAVKEALRTGDVTTVDLLYSEFADSEEFVQFADAMRANLTELLAEGPSTIEDTVGDSLHEYAMAVKEALQTRDVTEVDRIYGEHSRSSEFCKFADAMRSGLDELLKKL